jgi:uncharacterized membrane protein YeiH
MILCDMWLEQAIAALDFFGVAVFAITGAMAAGRKHMDLFGVVVLANVTAVGGGTLRDIILDAGPVFWVARPAYVWLASLTATIFFYLPRNIRFPKTMLITADAMGLSVFTAIGAGKALALGFPVTGSLVVGVMTGVAGGMIRDMVSGEVPLILRNEIYATASLAGAVVLAVLFFRCPRASVPLSMLVTFGLRMLAAKYNFSLPVFKPPARP